MLMTKERRPAVRIRCADGQSRCCRKPGPFASARCTAGRGTARIPHARARPFDGAAKDPPPVSRRRGGARRGRRSARLDRRYVPQVSAPSD
jgi:hypothetical protein